MKTPLPSLLLLSALLALSTPPARASDGRADVVTTAVEAGSFQTLARALTEAGLVEALRGEGPYTVFAPTDAAFEKLPEGALARLLEPGNREELRAVLAYHVVPGRVLSSDLLATAHAQTLEGRTLPIGLRVGAANVVQADLLCSNGVIHVIDAVLVPPKAATSDTAFALPASPADVIRSAIRKGVPLYNDGHPAACAAVYEVAAEALLQMPGSALGRVHRDLLRAALAEPASDAKAKAWTLRGAFDAILADLAFEPLVEAPMPEGFPAPGPLGEVTVKTYPRYRAARTEGGSAFWTLFRHIKRHDIAMTAPVEMTMDDEMRQVDMAFLYASPDLGASGRQGDVAVVDLPPATVLSVGMRGASSAEAVERAKALIETRLGEDGWTRAGAWRLLGYNSPMVPAAKRFWELQLPVERARP